MSEQELKRLKRSEILEIMIEQTKAVKAMREETDQMKDQLEDYRERVKEQNDTIARLRAGIVNGSAESEEESRQLDIVYKQIEQKIRGQRARIKELEAEVASLKQQLNGYAPEPEPVHPEDTTVQMNKLLDDAKRASGVFRLRSARRRADDEGDDE